MTPEHDKTLCRDFPLLYKDRHLDIRSTCMSWGFECGDGWFQLLYDLSEKIEPLIQKYIDDNPEEEYHPCAGQVKEKFGTLRFYMTSYADDIEDLITEAETLSGTTCEQCGEPGRLRGEHWVYTACDEHTQEGDKK